ncbi:beta-1,4-galactosyltransferase galt-1-like [Cryptosporidium felis]|nr:beta-1,4-galactosyltransferase galt-1-like [Cryptosporidium felis]
MLGGKIYFVLLLLVLLTTVISLLIHLMNRETLNRSKRNIENRKLFTKFNETELRENQVHDWQTLSILVPIEGNFEKKDNTAKEFKVYIFSSFYDERIGRIRINSLIPLKFDHRIQLRCGVQNGSNFYEGNVEQIIHKEHHNKDYVSSTLLCYFKERKPELVIEDGALTFVSIFEKTNHQNKSEKLLRLHQIPKNSPKKSLSICVRPWWGEPLNQSNSSKQKFDDAGLLLEFFNSYALLGVEKIYMYQNYLGLNDDVKMIVEYYSTVKQLVQVIPFTLPIIPFEQVWDFAQTSMIQDCLLRTLGYTKYLLFVDTDEFVFPTQKGYNLINFLDLVETSNSYQKNEIGAMWIPMYFHFLEWESDEQNEERYSKINANISGRINNLEFILFRKTCRMLKAGTKKGENRRRKVIIRPERVLYMGIHEPEKMANEKYHFIKAPIVRVQGSENNELTLHLHHYRRAKGVVNNDPKKKELIDMYLENDCSYGISKETVIDNVVWEVFGLELYRVIDQDIQNMLLKSN